MDESTEDYKYHKIYAFQCVFCLEKFDIIGPKLGPRLLKHFYDLHAEMQNSKDIQIIETLKISPDEEEDYQDFIIEEIEFNKDGQQQSPSSVSIIKTEPDLDIIEYAVLSDCSVQCNICSMVFKNWNVFEEHRKNCDPETNEQMLSPASPDFEHVEFLEDEFKDTKELEELEPITTEFKVSKENLSLNILKDTNESEETNPEFTDMKELEQPEPEFVDCRGTKKLPPLRAAVCSIEVTKADEAKTLQLPKPQIYTCEICQKTFIKANYLRNHKKTHESKTGDDTKKVKRRSIKLTDKELEKCDYGLPNPGNPLMQWKCRSCNTMFATKCALNTHFRRSHINKIKTK